MTDKPIALFAQAEHIVSAESMTLYAMLNPLAQPSPVSDWHQQGWVMNAIPLYVQTPMRSILHASPWLVELPWATASTVLSWAEQQPDPSWGWLYASSGAWLAQKEHWQRYLRGMLDGQLKALRFHDPRLLSIWLAANEPALWAGLLSPVEVLRLPSGQVWLKNSGNVALNNDYPWTVPPSLIDAWHRSEPGINSAVMNFSLQLWEERADDASQWDSEDSPFSERIRPWLTACAQRGDVIQTLTLDDALAWLTQQGTLTI
ncbi:DUF4123 domain-containing protein [Aeromonas veronii]|uniref:DUF4123 domain-containing protein n=1 Tax=Aeromonas veronii TaxID=654 RepID=UPI000817D8FD|nr:DUF4123 domain-containing protein [Aeromonas veronii]MCJ8217384.1 DUF4123 domain-containing protein [Aeromonas veronii]OCQ43009.1 hypothetical protein A6767_08610 [Aeromonas veronii]WOE83921.1 DUF4123 domain-containing protein [Aeromonas veronii]